MHHTEANFAEAASARVYTELKLHSVESPLSFLVI